MERGPGQRRHHPRVPGEPGQVTNHSAASGHVTTCSPPIGRRRCSSGTATGPAGAGTGGGRRAGHSSEAGSRALPLDTHCIYLTETCIVIVEIKYLNLLFDVCSQRCDPLDALDHPHLGHGHGDVDDGEREGAAVVAVYQPGVPDHSPGR